MLLLLLLGMRVAQVWVWQRGQVMLWCGWYCSSCWRLLMVMLLLQVMMYGMLWMRMWMLLQLQLLQLVVVMVVVALIMMRLIFVMSVGFHGV